jgi:hypothetical protein
LFRFPSCILSHTLTHAFTHPPVFPHTEAAERKRFEQQLAALQLAHQQRVDSARQEQAREETEQDLAHARAMADAQDAHRAQVQYTALSESDLSLLFESWARGRYTLVMSL